MLGAREFPLKFWSWRALESGIPAFIGALFWVCKVSNRLSLPLLVDTAEMASEFDHFAVFFSILFVMKTWSYACLFDHLFLPPHCSISSEIVEINFVLWMHGFELISCRCLVLEQLCVNVRYPEFWLLTHKLMEVWSRDSLKLAILCLPLLLKFRAFVLCDGFGNRLIYSWCLQAARPCCWLVWTHGDY